MDYIHKNKATQFLSVLASGAFVMAEDRYGREIYIVKPRQRTILPLYSFHIPKRLARLARQNPFTITINKDFEQVMTCCAQRQPTWINQSIIDGYIGLHRLGFAHSVEAWQKNRLVGGLYGVALGSAFFGESMFSYQSHASKMALIHLVARLIHARFTLLDAQLMTKHLKQFGAVSIPNALFQRRLTLAKKIKADFHAMGENISCQRSLQEIGQIS